MPPTGTSSRSQSPGSLAQDRSRREAAARVERRRAFATDAALEPLEANVMPPDQIIAFFVFAVVAAVTPGPSNVMVMIAGARAGVVGGLPCLAGAVAGMVSMMGAAALGLGSVVLAYPQAVLALKWAGSLFLLWLAWKVASAPPMSAVGASDPVGFWKAAAFQWINPKSWIVSVSAAATYGGASDANVVAHALLLALVFALAAAPSFGVWLAFGASVQRWLVDERRSRAISVAMGVALAASVVFVAR
jgi:threonine/homoserine/homoserine lactone efflux protein